MNRKILLLLIVLFGGGVAMPLCAQVTPDVREAMIRSLEDAERLAVLDSDAEKLQKLWSPFMIVNNPQSTVSPDREAVLALVRNGFIKYSSFERRIEAVRFHGDIAIVMGAETVQAIGHHPKAGQQVTRRFTNIWSKVEGTWQIIARHANAVPE